VVERLPHTNDRSIRARVRPQRSNKIADRLEHIAARGGEDLRAGLIDCHS